MTADAMPNDVRGDAAIFILHMLLRRLEQQQPGLMQGMIDGILNDRAALPAAALESSARLVGDEALRMLNLANDQLKIPWSPLPSSA